MRRIREKGKNWRKFLMKTNSIERADESRGKLRGESRTVKCIVLEALTWSAAALDVY